MSSIPLYNDLKDLNNMGHFSSPRDDNIIRDVIDKSNPLKILEIGFNMGHSATMWLHYSNADLVSVDSCVPIDGIDRTSIMNYNADLIAKYYKERFIFFMSDSRYMGKIIYNMKFDLISVDGGHTPGILLNDINMAIGMGIPYIFVDDVFGEQALILDEFVFDRILEVKKYFNFNKHRILYCLKNK